MNLLKDRLLVVNLLPLILALAITISIPLIHRALPLQLPLFYSLPWGENQLVTLDQFLILPATIVLIDLINLIIYWQLHSEQTLFKQIVVTTSLLTSIILTVSFLKIIFIFL